jgi:L-ascorbate metabolism protein UlaG (beta-lactamase superfamily)
MLQSGLCGKPDDLHDPCDRLGLSVKVVQAVHTAGIETGGAPQGYGGASVGFILTFENGLRLYFSGDTGLLGDMKLIGELYQPHVAILSAAGRFMLEPEDAALAATWLRTRNPDLKTIIPAHHVPGVLPGTPEQVAAEVERLGLPVTVLELMPGDTFTLLKSPAGPQPK